MVIPLFALAAAIVIGCTVAICCQLRNVVYALERIADSLEASESRKLDEELDEE
jgi:hypothetical protein